MGALNAYSQPVLDWLVAASWQLALLVCAIALITRLLHLISTRLSSVRFSGDQFSGDRVGRSRFNGARFGSAKFRYALWLLVLIKVFLPPGLTAPWSIGRWVTVPTLGAPHRSPAESSSTRETSDTDSEEQIATSAAEGSAVAPGFTLSPALLVLIWAGGSLVFFAIVLRQYWWLTTAIRSSQSIDEGPIRVTLEQIAISLGVHHVPELVSTNFVTSPFLVGTRHPRIVLPEQLLAQLGEADLRSVLTHELVHWQRRDTWIGWLQVIAQSIFWFHPFMWWANREIRHAREAVCDEIVLQRGAVSPRHYGESIIRVLSAVQGHSLLGATQVGIFEKSTNLQSRLEDIMNYDPIKRQFAWPARIAFLVLALLLLPMAAGVNERGQADERPTSGEGESRPPQIAKSIPKLGETGVDPKLAEITVVFDRDMRKGMSWTGGPPLFPPVDTTRKPKWTDDRTCVLPVKLEQGKYYRLGINSTSYQNFRSRQGVAVPPSSIYFSTRGASAAIEARARTPEVVSLEPKNGARDVDPKSTELKVTFNIPMGDGMSWTGGGPNFPALPEGAAARWSADGLSCTLPVKLTTDHDYDLGLNSVSHINFQSASGVPLKPVVYKFRTRGVK